MLPLRRDVRGAPQEQDFGGGQVGAAKPVGVLVEHRVVGDLVREGLELLGRRQLAVQQQPGHLVALPHPDAVDACEAALPLEPAVAGDDHEGVFRHDVGALIELRRRVCCGARHPRAALLAVAHRALS